MAPSGSSTRVLVVDDSPGTLEILRRNLQSEGLSVDTAPGGAEALRALARGHFDLVVTDLKMPRSSGMEVIRHVRENLPETQVMMITGYASVEGAVDAMKAGAEEYLAKPFTDSELLGAVRRSLARLATRRLARLGLHDPPELPGIFGQSEAIRELAAKVDRAARSHATVLISGESGTGKELVARSIHYRSERRANPFLPVNCGAIPENLLESELFGHLKGAFTGAASSRAGFFQTADGGTIFLDEVGEMTPTMQVRLLRVLQDGEVTMVGSSKPRKVDVRIVAATNKDLAWLVGKSAFREDLYFRLNVVGIHVPPLRDRGDDVVILAHHFARTYAEDMNREAPRFTQRALSLLRSYHWPGNVRELENVVHRLLVMCDHPEIDAPELPPLLRAGNRPTRDVLRTLAEVEGEHILAVLGAVDGNKSQAAAVLGIDRKTLRSKLDKIAAEGAREGTAPLRPAGYRS